MIGTSGGKMSFEIQCSKYSSKSYLKKVIQHIPNNQRHSGRRLDLLTLHYKPYYFHFQQIQQPWYTKPRGSHEATKAHMGKQSWNTWEQEMCVLERLGTTLHMGKGWWSMNEYVTNNLLFVINQTTNTIQGTLKQKKTS